jgi:hypothetical protein
MVHLLRPDETKVSCGRIDANFRKNQKKAPSAGTLEAFEQLNVAQGYGILAGFAEG